MRISATEYSEERISGKRYFDIEELKERHSEERRDKEMHLVKDKRVYPGGDWRTFGA